MSINLARPDWLSVPAADGAQSCACQVSGCSLRGRLLRDLARENLRPCSVRALCFVADHGVAAAPQKRSGFVYAGSVEDKRRLQRVLRLIEWLSSETRVEVLDLGGRGIPFLGGGTRSLLLGPGTADSRVGAAMDKRRLDIALSAGRHAIERARLAGGELVVATGAGRGAGITSAAWQRLLGLGLSSDAADAIDCMLASAAALKFHAPVLGDPYQGLCRLGGFEHAALVGAAIGAAQLGMRFIGLGDEGSIACALASRLNPSIDPWIGAFALPWPATDPHRWRSSSDQLRTVNCLCES